MELLSVSGVTKKRDEDFVLSDISFTQHEQQKIAVAGETGSGKTTLLKMIAGLIQPDKGEIILEGEHVSGPDEVLVPGHSFIAYLSQQYELPKFLRVEQILKYNSNLSGDDARLLYEICRITEFMKRGTNELSGGEKQRIALAMALTASPKLLLLDEPFSNLDIINKSILKSVINDIGTRLKITCILVSHDPLDTLSWADEIIVLKAGQLIQKDTPQNIYTNPVNEYTAGLFGKYNLIDDDLFQALSNTNESEKKVIVRPESITLQPAENNAMTGKIVSISYFGSYHEIDVSISGKILTARMNRHSLKVGDQVNALINTSNA